MLLAPEMLIDGVVRTLREAVLPALEDRVARAHLYAAIDVLQNLRDRVEEKAALAEAEAASAAEALAALPADVRAAVSVAAGGPAGARRDAMRAALVAAFAALDGCPPDVAAPARAALAGHLSGQAMRDVALLKPSLLHEISKG
jgi:hypothetical protein